MKFAMFQSPSEVSDVLRCLGFSLFQWPLVSIPFRGFRRAEIWMTNALLVRTFQSPSEVSDVLSRIVDAVKEAIVFQSPSEVSDVLSLGR